MRSTREGKPPCKMTDMGIRPKFVPPFSTGLSRGVRPPGRSQAASYKESCKSSWECGSASVISMPSEQPMGGATQPPRRKKNHGAVEANLQEGAGGLLLLAAAHETGLLGDLETAIASCEPTTARSLLSSSPRCLHQLMLTLLFFPLGGLHRTHDLRSYTGNVLAVVTGRSQAYGYCHTERFLSQLAKANGAEALTTALGSWTAHLWEEGLQEEAAPCLYIDGHRKPVYADGLIPRGLIGRTGKILGGRALALLHDEQGHPRLATTSRGDQHLTVGLPQVMARYEQAGGKTAQARIIVDREGMAAPFLRDLTEAGHTIVTLLKTNQYEGLTSFTEVGEFVPLTGFPQRPGHPRSGASLLRACLTRSKRSGSPEAAWPSSVTFVIRFPVRHRKQTPMKIRGCLLGGERIGKRSRALAEPTTARLIPIVTTASHSDAVELAQTYIRRWPLQENVIRDYLLPLGLDTNHGYGKK